MTFGKGCQTSQWSEALIIASEMTVRSMSSLPRLSRNSPAHWLPSDLQKEENNILEKGGSCLMGLCLPDKLTDSERKVPISRGKIMGELQV